MALNPDVKLQQHQVDFTNKVLQQDGQLLASHAVGTGKTLSSIAAFEKLRDAGKAKRALVVVPASLRNNFIENGVRKFTNSRAALFGTAEEVRSGEAHSADAPDNKADYHVISYEMFLKDPEKYLKAAGADTVIYDELHRVRNESSKSLEAVKKIRPLHKNFIGLTGSIVNNDPSDIVPLIDAMTNGEHKLGTKQTFQSRFVSDPDKDGRRQLKNPMVLKVLLAPYTHHVEQLSSDMMPKKRVEEVKIDMTPEQKELYGHVMGKLDPVTALKLKFGDTKLKSSDVQNIFNKIIQARQVTNALHTINKSMTLSESARKSPKVRAMLNDVEDHLKETPDGQVVLYSNLVQGGVDVLKQGLKDRGIDHAVFVGRGQDGGSEEARQEGVKEFQEGKKRVIVLSSAGKEGLDLRNTTFMGMLDGHFNPEVIAQAEARGVRAGGQAHREPDKRQVVIRRYVTKIPTSITSTLTEIGKLLSPAMAMERLQTGAPLLYNPLKGERSTDEWIYGVARNKNAVNKELRGVLKTSSGVYLPDTFEDLHEMVEASLDVRKTATFDVSTSTADEMIRHLDQHHAATMRGVEEVRDGLAALSKANSRAPSRVRPLLMAGAGVGALGLLGVRAMRGHNKRSDAEIAEPKKPTTGENLRDAAVIGGSAYGAHKMITPGAERLLGAQRFVHGTSRPAAKAILKDGLDPNFGGKEHGASAAIRNEQYIQNSTGKIHVAKDTLTGRTGAHGFASLSGASQAARDAGRHLSREEGVRESVMGFFLGPRSGGVVGGVMPIEDFNAKFHVDPDAPGLGWRTTEKIDPSHLQSGRAGLRKVIENRSRDVLRYIGENKGRAALGLAGVAGAGLLGANAVMRARDAYHKNFPKQEAAAPAKEGAAPLWKGLFSKGLVKKSRIPFRPSFPKIAAGPAKESKEQAKERKDAIRRLDYQPFARYKSDSYIRNAYLSELGERAMALKDPTAGELETAEDREKEMTYINALRAYYRLAGNQNNKLPSGMKDSDRLKLMSTVGAVTSTIGSMYGGMSLAAPIGRVRDGLATSGAVTALGYGGGTLGGMLFNNLGPGAEISFGTSKAQARRASQFTDEELRQLLRGQAVSKEITKKQETFIK